MATKTRKKPASSSVDSVRRSIQHPVLAEAYDVDWFYPWQIPAAARKEKNVQRAIREGWAEWLETEEDLEAVRKGYVFDLSRDKQGRPIFWMHGHWYRYQGTGAAKRLAKIHYESESDVVAYCGAGDHMCRFCESTMVFTKDPQAGKPYRFMAWQRKLAMTLYGWVTISETAEGKRIRYRRFNEAIIEVPKKSGKSDFGSVNAVYLTRADFTNKAYVYGCASDRKQAGIVYREAADYVNKSPFLAEEMQVVESRSRITHLESGSFYEAISGDAARNDGHDASAVIFDELHRQKNRKFYVVMRRAGRARRGKFLRLVITTYGESYKGIWGEEHLKAKSQLSGRKANYRKLVFIASAEPITIVTTESAPAGAVRIPVWRLEQPVDAGEICKFESTSGLIETKLTAPAKRFQPFIEVEPLPRSLPAHSEAIVNKDWRTDHAIRRANPSVGIVFPIEDIREDINDSVGPEAEAEVKQLSLNIVSGGGRRWLSGAAWQACSKQRILMSSLLGQRCFGGLDFSFTTDLTAFWLAFPSWPSNVKFSKVDDPIIKLIGLVWVPEDGIEEREEKEEIPYRAYAETPYFGEFGCVRICPGPVINYQMVGRDIISLCERFKTQAIGYDPNYSQFVVQPFLDGSGLRCIVHRQGYLSMGPPTKRFEELVKRAAIVHGNHPLLDAAVDGAVLHAPDKVGNRYPTKEKSLSRVDALIAAIMATGWACDPPQDLKSTGAWTGKGTGIFE